MFLAIVHGVNVRGYGKEEKGLLMLTMHNKASAGKQGTGITALSRIAYRGRGDEERSAREAAPRARLVEAWLCAKIGASLAEVLPMHLARRVRRRAVKTDAHR